MVCYQLNDILSKNAMSESFPALGTGTQEHHMQKCVIFPTWKLKVFQNYVSFSRRVYVLSLMFRVCLYSSTVLKGLQDFGTALCFASPRVLWLRQFLDLLSALQKTQTNTRKEGWQKNQSNEKTQKAKGRRTSRVALKDLVKDSSRDWQPVAFTSLI